MLCNDVIASFVAHFADSNGDHVVVTHFTLYVPSLTQ